MIYENLSVNEQGILVFAEKSTEELVQKYGTPLYVMDESLIRERLRTYKNGMKAAFGPDAKVFYASKACDFLEMYRIVQQEQCGVDVVSKGEIFTAWKAGFDMKNACFHGNSKTDEEISFALEKNVGMIVVDSMEELDVIEQMASQMNKVQDIMLRVTPGVDPHTYEAVATGLVDSKFGSAIQTGAAKTLCEKALQLNHVHLLGFHCHVGSQVFDEEVFVKCADVMFRFMKQMKEELGFCAECINLGGGFGVRYTEKEHHLEIEKTLMKVGKYIHSLCERLELNVPAIYMEPGRSIVADSGMTLYRVGSVKKIEGIKNYVSVDGGMTDNPRFALYKSSYTVLCANRMNEKKDFLCSVVGKCCESGDTLQENVLLPSSVKRNDLIAVLTTGAYNYSMASNYNRILRAPVVMIHGSQERLVVQRESFEDLIKNEI